MDKIPNGIWLIATVWLIANVVAYFAFDYQTAMIVNLACMATLLIARKKLIKILNI